MTNTGGVGTKQGQLLMSDESPKRSKHNGVSTNAGVEITSTAIPKLDFLCTVLAIDERFSNTPCSKTDKLMVDWGAIKDLTEELSKSSAAKFPMTSLAAGPVAMPSSSTVVIEPQGDVNPQQRCNNSPQSQRHRQQRQVVLSKTTFEPLNARPLPRPPLLPNCRHQSTIGQKRVYNDMSNNDNNNNTMMMMLDCKGKVYLPSGKSLDVSAKHQHARCTDAGLVRRRMDPLSPPPFTLPKKFRVGILPH